MDIIFRKTNSIFSLVSVAKHEPRRYDSNGELLLTAESIDDNRLRQASVVSGMLPGEDDKGYIHEDEKVEA